MTKRQNRYDEGMKEVFTSKTFKVIAIIFTAMLCCPGVFMCLSLMGIPIIGFLETLLGGTP